MKKKLIQILMLMVATVSVGSFVSCKDTNEDLYNELRTQNLETMTLAQALDARVKALEDLIAKINSCECDTVKMLGWVNSEDQHLQAQIDLLKKALEGLANADDYYTKAQIDKMRDAIQNQIDDIPLIYATINDLNALTARVAAIEYLKEEVKTLREKLDKIKSCECDLAKLAQLESELNALTNRVNTLADDLKATDEIAKAAKTLAENAQSTADNAKTLAETANSTANQANTLAQTCKDLLDNAVQWASDAKSDAAAAKALAESNEKKIAALEETVKNLNTEVTLASKDAKDALKAASDADTKATENKNLIDKLTERVKANEVNIENLKKDVEEMKGLAEKVGANTEAIKNLQKEIEKYEKLAEEVAGLKQEVADCQKVCAANLEAAKATIRLEMAQMKEELVDRISANEAEIKEHHEALKQIAAMIKDFVTKDDLQKVNDRLDALEALKLDELKDKVINDLEPRVKALEDDINGVGGLKDRIKAAEDRLDKIEPTITELAKKIDAIQSQLAKQVTGIIVQGTYNPMFGSFNIPLNIQSNVLVAYFGNIMDPNLEFPTTEPDNYVATSKHLTAEDWNIIGSDLEEQITGWWPGLPLLNDVGQDGEAKAGKVYMTINPTTADLTGLKLDLVNSQDVAAPIKLKEIRKSNETLQFGFGRAADNGFYEADAYVDDNFSSTINTGKLTDDMIDLGKTFREKMSQMADNFFGNGTNSGDLSRAATEVYNIIHELRMDRSGLKVTYTDQDELGNDQTHSVYSQYNVAAAVIEPLGLNSFKDVFNYKTVPGYESLESFIDAFADTLNHKVQFIFEDANGSWKLNQLLNNLKIDGVDLDAYATNLINKFRARVSSFTFDGNGYYFQIPATGNAIILFDKNLKNGGAAVAIPDAAKFNSYNDLKGVTLVIGGDLASASTTTATLYVPAKADGESTVSAYAFAKLENVTVNVTAGVIEVACNGTKVGEVGNLTGSSINTTGYSDKLVLENLKGTDGSVSIPVAVEMADDAQSIVDKLAVFVKDLNHTLAEINKYKDIIAGTDGWINQGFDKFVRQYLDKINNTTVYFFNSIPRRFGPFMVASNGGKFFRLSTSKYAPTTVTTTDLRFYPTSKNMELIVPIARKHIAFTDVYTDDGTKSAKGGDGIYKQNVQNINKQNADLNKVIDGTQRMIEVNTSGMAPGYTYEVAYSVLDFQGKISTEKYYIKIAK